MALSDEDVDRIAKRMLRIFLEMPVRSTYRWTTYTVDDGTTFTVPTYHPPEEPR